MAAPKPVLIFAGGYGEARDFARAERLQDEKKPALRHATPWVFVRDPDQARYLPAAGVAILPGFPRNVRYDLLAPLAEMLEVEHGPYVPRDATHNGRTEP